MNKLLAIFAALVFAMMSFHQVQGQAVVSGRILEQDYTTPIAGVSVLFSGQDAQGNIVDYQAETNASGRFEHVVNDGMYWVSTYAEGYQPASWIDSLWVDSGSLPFEYDTLVVECDTLTGICDSLYLVYNASTGQYDTLYYPYPEIANINLILHEVVAPVNYVAARLYSADMVRVSWSRHDPVLYDDFETGDFSKVNWVNASPYPWTISDEGAYEGGYCMRSSCQGVSNGISQIEVSVFIPFNGEMSFYGRISSENNWDKGSFYLDGVKKVEISGEVDWTQYVFAVTQGEHVFRWTYQKDNSTDVGDDCFYVDAIYFGQETSEGERSLRYYDLYRRRADQAPVLLASHLTDTVYMDTRWSGLPWGRYSWGVTCYYEGNRPFSDTTWSVLLDKDMTTTFEANITTNTEMSASGAVVTLSSPGHTYQTAADANGHLLLPDVYRDQYDLRVHLDGYVDYVSELSVLEPQQVDIELMEAVYGIDSLYVSSTGFAMWQLSDTLFRDLQYFELRLNGQSNGRVTLPFFQFDVSELLPGDTCWAEVRPVYLSDTCDWRSAEWVYRPCSDYQGSVNGLQWSINNDAVLLSWEVPEGDSVLGARLYRDGEFLAFVEGNTYLDPTVVMHGEVTYCLRLVYYGAMDGDYYSMSCEECAVTSFPLFCDPPVNLEGENYYHSETDYGALISWGERPDPVQSWLYYDNGVYKRSLGSDNEPIIFWSIRFDAADLEDYAGTALKKISLFDVGAGTYQLWVYVGGETAPRTLVWSQNMTLSNAHDWHEETINSAVEIPEDEPLWIVVGQQGLSRPAAACADQGNPNGRWVSLDGEHWLDLAVFNMHYTWMLRAFVSNRSGRMRPLDAEGYALQQYNLYRGYNPMEYQQVATIPAVEGQAFYQYRDVLVDEDHVGFYYRLTAVYLSDDGETCESDFASALYDPDVQYVYVDDNWSTEERAEAALKLYPNPSNGQITIEQEGMQSVLVYNALGQLLLDKEASADHLQLDLSGFENGLYWVRVMSQSGAVTRRFVLSR